MARPAGLQHSAATKGKNAMPLIDIHVLEGVFSAEEKAAMIRETAEGFGRVAGRRMRDATSVRVHEVPSGCWGGANGLWTTETAKALRSGTE